KALVTDTSGKAIPGVSVTFSAPVSGASGRFANGQTSETRTTDQDGVATSTTFTANGTAGGPYTVMATTAGAGTPANFILTNTASAPATRVAFVQQPTSGAARAVITPPVTVQVEDTSGNPVG